MKYLLALLVLIPTLSFGQSISVSPMSFKAWGQGEGITSISIDYSYFSAHYFSSNSSVAVSVKPIEIKNTIKAGLIGFNKQFLEGSRINAILEIGHTFDFGRISYVHISNAGLGGKNIGMDSIKLSIPLKSFGS